MKPKLIDTAIAVLAILVAIAQQAKAGAGDGQPEDMVLVPGGSFFQGSADDEPGYRDIEGPRREVHLAPFLLSRHEVTVGQFKAFVERSGYVTDAERNTRVDGSAAEGCWSHQRPGEFSPAWVARRDWRDHALREAIAHMKGNASEWVADCWHTDYQGAPIDGSAREADAGAQCSARVLRGGDFVGGAASLRDTHRSYIPPAFRTYHAGFRMTRDL